TSDMDNTDKVMRYIGDCRDMGIAVLPPDINEGSYGFTVGGDSIRFGLGAIKGVGEQAITALMQERQEHGPFRSFFDLCERLDTRHVNKKGLESLMKGRALDSLGLTRAPMLGNLGRVLDWGQRQDGGQHHGQFSLFRNSTV